MIVQTVSTALTALALAIHAEDTTTVKCAVMDYRTGAEFDLSNLQNMQAVTPGGATDTIYDIHPCGKAPVTTIDTGKCEFPFACQYPSVGDMKILGKDVYHGQIQPLVTDGQVPKGAKLLLKNGQECSNGMKRELDIHYYCQESGEDRLVIEETFKCAYFLYVYTKEACPTIAAPVPPSPAACTYTHSDGRFFDLSPLKKLTGNHVITDSNPYEGHDDSQQKVLDEYEFIINVCQDINVNKAVAHDSAVQNCHEDRTHPGICQIYYDDTPPYQAHYRLVGQTVNKNTGDYNKMIMEDGVLKMKYGNGQARSGGGVRKGEIHFHCLEGSGIGKPEYMVEDTSQDDTSSTYYFSWTTEHACPKKNDTGDSKGMSGGAIFALITFVIIPSVILLYCLVGVFFNKQSGKSGMDLIPHIDLMRNVCSCCFSGSSYSGLSISADSETRGQSLMDDDYE